MFNKMVLCSDDSEGALTAARMGARIAAKFHSSVLLLRAYDPADAAYPTVAAGTNERPLRADGMDSYAEHLRVALVEHTGRILHEAGVRYHSLIEPGHPTEVITRLAKRHKADLIVIGSRGLGDLESLLIGSTSGGVLHQAHCPVLIVRGGHALRKPPAHGRILLATDGSAGASKAVPVAIRLAQEFGASLNVLNVLDASSLCEDLSPYLAAETATPYTCARDLLTEITREVTEEALKAGVAHTFHQETGAPADIIVGFAQRVEADLVVIGCRGMGELKSLLIGSVSNCVARESHCSVLVMR